MATVSRQEIIEGIDYDNRRKRYKRLAVLISITLLMLVGDTNSFFVIGYLLGGISMIGSELF